MRILVDAHSFDKERFQGVNTYIVGVYKEIFKSAPRHWEFIFYCKDQDYLKSVFGTNEKVSFYKPRFSGILYRFSIGLSKAIIDVKADYLHVQYKSPLLKLCKEWVTVHDVLFIDYPDYFTRSFRVLSNWLYRRSIRRADYINTVSDYSKRRIEIIYGVKNVMNTGMGLETRRLNYSVSKSLQVNEVLSSKYILCVSRIEPRKNQAYLFRLLSNMSEETKLVLVGSQTHSYPDFENYISANDNENIYWFENLEFSDLERLYTRAHITIYPSLCEGFGLPPMESLLYRTPVLFNDNTAMREYSDLAVFNLSLENHSKMAQQIDEICKSPKIEVNEVNLTKRFSWKNVAKKIIEKLEVYD